jgi:hypothetical protein
MNQAMAQTSVEAKIPRPLPHMQDIKTPPSLPAAKTGSSNAPHRPVPAHDAAASPSKPNLRAARAPRFEVDQVYFDQPGDGSIWALGAGYKASFRSSGATYIPFLGSCAPKDYPVNLALKSISVGGRALTYDSQAAPVRNGTRVTFDRGGVVELYDMKLASAEQGFVFESLPATGDLVLEVAVDSALEAAGTSEGLRWSNALGAVEYSRAVLVDAAQHRTPVLTQVNGGTLEIRVPADVLAGATFPIVVDPVITTFTVDDSTNDDTDPDIAYDATNGVYQVVWSRAFSATDHDCYSQLQSASGTTIVNSTVPIDFTGDDWVRPRTANNVVAKQFLVAAQVLPSGGSSRVIMGRTRDAASTNMGAQFQISDPAITSDQFNVSVGGDPSISSPSYYCVTWERIFTAGTDDDIFARLVASDSTLLGTNTILIDNSTGTLDENPSVSRCDGRDPFLGQDWTIVWQREYSPTDHDILGAQVHWDGTITNPSFYIDFSSNDDQHPQVSSVVDAGGVSRNYMVVWQRFIGPDNDIEGALLNGTTLIREDDLSEVEAGGFLGYLWEDQIQPSVDTDGAFFAVSYAEQYASSTTDYDIYLSSFSDTASGVQALEIHQGLATDPAPEHSPQITAQRSGGASSTRYAIVWSSEFSPTDHDVYGGLYDEQLTQSTCIPGNTTGVIGCPCANQGSAIAGCDNSSGTGGAVLTSSGVSSVSADSLVFHTTGEKPSATSIVLQGTSNLTFGTLFGQGVRCASGTLKRLYVKSASGGSITAPVGGDASVWSRSATLGDVIAAGQVRFYQVYYRDPIVLGGCSASSTFNATQGLQVAWMQ